MKAFILDRYAKNSGLRLGETPEPALGDDDVLVQIHAAGVNLLDSKIKTGEFKLILRYRLPLILGHDLAGVVIRVGPHVQQFKVVTRCTPVHLTFASEPSPNTSRSSRMRWPTSRKVSAWKKPLRSRWWASRRGRH